MRQSLDSGPSRKGGSWGLRVRLDLVREKEDASGEKWGITFLSYGHL